tara:strand:- start:298 stop:495 length:198 start_codon:yes stop_codon:yes gene_type:complete
MKNIGFFFFLAFLFFFIGQILWTIGLMMPEPFFGSKITEDWVINIVFTLCSIFGLIAGFKLYKSK